MKFRVKVDRGRGFGFILLLSLMAALCAQVFVYLAVIDMTIGTAPLLGNVNPTAASKFVKLEVAILRSEASSLAAGQEPAFYFDLSRKWQIVLQEAGIANRYVSDAELAAGLDERFDVLVLPAATCLGDGQKDSIVRFLELGKGVVASGALGARDAGCEWLGWGFLSRLAGVASPRAASSVSSFAAFRGGQFYSERVPAGWNLPLPDQEVVVVTAPSPDVFWSDQRLQPSQGNPRDEVALAVHGVRGEGRFAWFGFRETLPQGFREEQKTLDSYLAALAGWTGRQPIAVFADWPRQSQAAVLIAQDVQQNFQALRASADIFQRERIPVTFFCDPTTARRFGSDIREMSQWLEVAAAGDGQELFAGQARGLQAKRLASAKQELEQFGSQPVVGFYPPQGLSDAATVAALREAGYEYYFDGTGTGRGVPELMGTSETDLFSSREPRLARISRHASDDFEMLARFQGPAPAGQEFVDLFVAELRWAIHLNGVYTLLFRSDLLGAPANLPILEAILRGIKREPVWIASAKELVDWWRRREGIRVESRFVSGNRIRLSVTNRGSAAVEEASVGLYLPFRPRHVRVIPAVLRSGLPSAELSPEKDVLRLGFPSIEAQSSYVFLVALDEG